VDCWRALHPAPRPPTTALFKTHARLHLITYVPDLNAPELFPCFSQVYDWPELWARISFMRSNKSCFLQITDLTAAWHGCQCCLCIWSNSGFICRISQVHRLLALPPRIVSWNFSWFPPIVRLQVHLYHGPRPIIRRVNDAVVLASSMHCLCRTKNSASNLQPLGA
jgi:hypothetical protein